MFELSQYYDEVLGTDPSVLCIGTCEMLKEKSTINYSFVNEGSITTEMSADLPSYIVCPKLLSKIKFHRINNF